MASHTSRLVLKKKLKPRYPSLPSASSSAANENAAARSSGARVTAKHRRRSCHCCSLRSGRSSASIITNIDGPTIAQIIFVLCNLSAEFEAGKGRRRISTSSRVRPALPGISNVDSRQELKAQPPASPARSAPPSLLQCILMRFLYLRIQHPLENLC